MQFQTTEKFFLRLLALDLSEGALFLKSFFIQVLGLDNSIKLLEKPYHLLSFNRFVKNFTSGRLDFSFECSECISDASNILSKTLPSKKKPSKSPPVANINFE